MLSSALSPAKPHPPTLHYRYCFSATSLCAPQMMLAMCVRKPDDASTPTSFSQSGGSRRRLKSLKGSKSKTCKEAEKREQEEKTEPEVVRDDEDGHLIYSKGDILQSRCMPSTLLMVNYSLYVSGKRPSSVMRGKKKKCPRDYFFIIFIFTPARPSFSCVQCIVRRVCICGCVCVCACIVRCQD